MNRLFIAMLGGAVFSTALGLTATAQPNVQLRLNGYVMQRAAGAEKAVPIEHAAPKPGDVIKYVITATNGGSEPARNLAAVGRVPAGTSFYASLVPSGASKVEFSIDGGKTWSAAPMVKVHTASGDVLKKADASLYTMVRFADLKPLAAKSAVAYAYEVRVR